MHVAPEHVEQSVQHADASRDSSKEDEVAFDEDALQ
jgi:hypothetical protein